MPLTAGKDASTFDAGGYHPGCFSVPQNSAQQLEIALGSILTQNTNWRNASLSLTSLSDSGLLDLERLLDAETEQIASAIRSSGYYNQKTQTIRHFTRFLERYPFDVLEQEDTASAREKLLGVRGIGPETADSILLYALRHPVFVVDSYTRRFFSALGIVSESVRYETLQQLFADSLEHDLPVYQEYHALLVQHGKAHYSRKPYGSSDSLLRPRRISGKSEKS